MHIFSEALVIELLDGAVACLFAAAATSRARLAGANLAGSVIMGCIAAMCAPLLREAVLHGPAGMKLVVAALPSQIFIGACAALAAILILGGRARFLFFWLDSMSICLGASFYAAIALPELGIAGSMSLALACAFTPGLLRDVALGDVAMLAEKNWYGACAAFSAVVAMSLIIWFSLGDMPDFIAEKSGEIAALLGGATGVALRCWKGRDTEILL